MTLDLGYEKLLIVGFGNVGRSLAKLLAFKQEYIKEKYGIDLKIVGLVDSKGAVVKPEGLGVSEILRLVETPRSSLGLQKPYGKTGLSIIDVYDEVEPTIHVELTPPNYDDGEPGLSHIIHAINNHVDVVLANKAPLALYYDKIMSLAKTSNVRVKYKTTVMAGTPLLNLIAGLKGYEVEYVKGILNGTVNYILTEMHENLVTLEEALRKAQALGIAEPNPLIDLEGIDAAAKITIIANTLGLNIKLSDVARQSIRDINLQRIRSTIRRNRVLKQIAQVDFNEGKARVSLEEIPLDSPLAKVNGTYNAVEVNTSINRIVVVGKGAGRIETAYALLDDILSIALEKRGQW